MSTNARALENGVASLASRRATTRRCGRRAARTTTRAAVVDPATKISFPDASPSGLKALGAGVRVKRIAIVDVKVYALCLYVDAAKAREQRAKGLLRGEYDKELAIELAREVDGKTFYEALDDALNPRIREIATNLATKEDEDGNFMASVAEAAEEAEEAALDALAEMRDAFVSLKLKQGTKMTISWTPSASQKVKIDVLGETLGFESPVFAQALLDVYVGSAPVAPAAAQAFENGLARL